MSRSPRLHQHVDRARVPHDERLWNCIWLALLPPRIRARLRFAVISCNHRTVASRGLLCATNRSSASAREAPGLFRLSKIAI